MAVKGIISELIDLLENAPRIGNERDEPEGACCIQISDTLAKELAMKLKKVRANELNNICMHPNHKQR